jgi:hypothetical protein
MEARREGVCRKGTESVSLVIPGSIPVGDKR